MPCARAFEAGLARRTRRRAGGGGVCLCEGLARCGRRECRTRLRAFDRRCRASLATPAADRAGRGRRPEAQSCAAVGRGRQDKRRRLGASAKAGMHASHGRAVPGTERGAAAHGPVCTCVCTREQAPLHLACRSTVGNGSLRLLAASVCLRGLSSGAKWTRPKRCAADARRPPRVAAHAPRQRAAACSALRASVYFEEGRAAAPCLAWWKRRAAPRAPGTARVLNLQRAAAHRFRLRRRLAGALLHL